MIIGNSIIEYLEEETKKNDPAESSHWKKFNYDCSPKKDKGGKKIKWQIKR